MDQLICSVSFVAVPLLMFGFANGQSRESANPEALPDFDRLWDFSDPGATEQRFRELLPKAEDSGDLSYLLQLQTQIARCQGLQGKFPDCHATLDAVEQRLDSKSSLPRVRYLLERGRAFNSSGAPLQAKPLFVAAWEQATAEGLTRFAIDAAHMAAIVDTDLDGQVTWNRRALELIDKHPDQRRWLPAIYNNLGESYRARHEYDKALECFQKRAQWYRDQNQEPDMYTLKDIARMQRLLGQANDALAVIEPIAKELHKKSQPDGYISAEYGECLLATGKRDDARVQLLEAYELLSQDDYMTRHEPDELQRIKDLAAPQD